MRKRIPLSLSLPIYLSFSLLTVRTVKMFLNLCSDLSLDRRDQEWTCNIVQLSLDRRDQEWTCNIEQKKSDGNDFDLFLGFDWISLS